MSWYKVSNSSFNGLPQDIPSLRKMMLEGDEMVRYHIVYQLAKVGDYETVKSAAENDSSELVRNMAEQCLKRTGF